MNGGLEMVNEAIKKVRKEMEESNDEAVVVIGQYLLEVIEENKEAAEKIINPGKTIIGSLTEMSKVARKKAKNGLACIGHREGLKIVAEYYGIMQEANIIKNQGSMNKVVDMNDHKQAKQQVALELDLDDLL